MGKTIANRKKQIVIIAGPNGAGKTTFAQQFLHREAGFPDFINADLIAKGLSPFAPEDEAFRAGRIMLSQIATKVSAGKSFAFETTLSGLGYARHIRGWQKSGYTIQLEFLSLPSAELAIARVRLRVTQGGHNIPETVIRRRFDAGLRNLRSIYSKIVDTWALYDNSAARPVLLESGKNA